MSLRKEDFIEKFNMQDHPEGGFYVETFRSRQMIPTEGGERSASTAIYFLMHNDNVSRIHRIKSDEVWHFYFGCPMTVIELDETTKEFKSTILGSNILKGEVLQYVVKQNTWFGSFPNCNDDHDFSFVGCTVAPGFDFSDFELGSNSSLKKLYTNADSIIDKLTVGLA